LSTGKNDTTLLRVLVMSWMALLGMIGTGLVGPNLSSIERELRIDHSQFGAAFAVIQVLCSLAVLVVARRARSFDSGGAFLLSLVVQTAGFGVVFLSRTALVLGAGWTLITLGTVLGSVANNVSARLWADNPRRGVTLLHGFNGIGKVVGPLIAIGCLALGWRLSFLAVGIITVALLAGFWATRERMATLSHESASERREQAAVTRTGPGFWLCVLPFGLIAGGDVCFAALMPSFYERVHQLSPENASLLLTAHLVGLAVGRFAFVPLNERLGNHRVIALCLAAGVFLVPALLGRSPWVWALGVFGVGWMFSSTWPTYYAQIAPHFADRPAVLDYGSALGNALGIAVCVYGASALAEQFPTAALLVGPAALWVFGAVYFTTALSRSDAKAY
jgi:predicted MFS family arabinose efflux permease